MKDIGKTTCSTVLEYRSTVTATNIKDNGQITKNMDRGSTPGLMAEAMREITEMIKSTAMELILGQMEENISENGKMIKDMEEERM